MKWISLFVMLLILPWVVAGNDVVKECSWIVTFNSTSPWFCVNVIDYHDFGSNVLVIGSAKMPARPRDSLWMAVLDRDGNLVVQKVIASEYYMVPKVVVFLNDSAIVGIAGGGSDAPWIGYYFVARILKDGRVPWGKYYTTGLSGDDIFWTLNVTGLECQGKCIVNTESSSFVIRLDGEVIAPENITGFTLNYEEIPTNFTVSRSELKCFPWWTLGVISVLALIVILRWRR
ncbi:hypothetical protein [Pyrococcus kukulkanii]|uniref:Uncharacterized protein n=1 Tax=Pyrococcus kukulkanii TaxID=1609559 RepID=A0A127BAD1_9EURY|nr:hypothetical protein [Pyrococcus kukulkanii]AMM54145.1 hypothetical protein TQ32_06380 [Pyrococcus kukulkanii]